MRLFERTKAAGEIRSDIEVSDISLLLEQLAAVRVADEERTRQLRHRYLALHLDALHAPPESLLPGTPPSWEEINQRWETNTSQLNSRQRCRVKAWPGGGEAVMGEVLS